MDPQNAMPTAVSGQPELRARVFKLAGPAIVENLLHTMVGVVDTAMVGRLGAYALASVGLANQIFNISLTVFAALATGSTALVARYIGAESREEAAEVARQSLVVGVYVSGVVLLALVGMGPAFLRLLFPRAEEAVLYHGGLYVRIVAAAQMFNYFLIIINGVLRGAGDTQTPMRITALVNGINVILNAFLIYGIGPFPALGVAGAAIATAISQSIGGLLAARALLRSQLVLVKLSDSFRPNAVMIKRIMNIGVPAGVEQGIMRVAQLAYTMIVSSLGTVAYAAHQVALNAESLSFMPGAGFAVAATTLVGQNLGAERPDEAEKAGYESRRMAVVVMSVMGVVFLLFPRPLVSIFSADPEVMELAVVCLRLVAVSQPALATIMVLAGALRGAGDTRAIVKITLLGFILVRICVAYVLAVVLGIGLVGAWIGMVVDLFFRSFLINQRFRGGQWKLIRV
ncbi:MAG TPA: MATE family efflux transporter [Firmicutes bacterium]|nr:MATE family efflux transporter [Bacillota bacterium]